MYAMAQNSTESKCLVKFAEAKVLAPVKHNYRRKLREAIEIKKYCEFGFGLTYCDYK